MVGRSRFASHAGIPSGSSSSKNAFDPSPGSSIASRLQAFQSRGRADSTDSLGSFADFDSTIERGNSTQHVDGRRELSDPLGRIKEALILGRPMPALSQPNSSSHVPASAAQPRHPVGGIKRRSLLGRTPSQGSIPIPDDINCEHSVRSTSDGGSVSNHASSSARLVRMPTLAVSGVDGTDVDAVQDFHNSELHISPEGHVQLQSPPRAPLGPKILSAETIVTVWVATGTLASICAATHDAASFISKEVAASMDPDAWSDTVARAEKLSMSGSLVRGVQYDDLRWAHEEQELSQMVARAELYRRRRARR